MRTAGLNRRRKNPGFLEKFCERNHRWVRGITLFPGGLERGERGWSLRGQELEMERFLRTGI